MSSKLISSYTFILAILCSHAVLAWGEGGHQIIGQTAAKLVERKMSWGKHAKNEVSVGRLFGDKAFAMGHAANIPDIGWRSDDQPAVVQALNAPTHFLNPELFLGAPGNDTKKYAEQIASLPGVYSDLYAKYSGKSSPILGTKEFKDDKIDVFEGGTAPWRVEQLYHYLSESFRCFAVKSANKNFTADLRLPIHEPMKVFDPAQPIRLDSIPANSYECANDPLSDPRENRFSDLKDSLEIAGVLGHFVGDLVQPYHVTLNYDGWLTGNGGIHSYFESEVVESYPNAIRDDILKKANDREFQKQMLARIGIDESAFANLSKPGAVAQLMLKVVADSYLQIPRVTAADDQFAIRERSDEAELGKKGHHRAKRNYPDKPEVLEGFKPIIVEQLALGSYLLSELWIAAWKDGQTPYLNTYDRTINRQRYPIYPLNPPFIWPGYDRKEIELKL